MNTERRAQIRYETNLMVQLKMPLNGEQQLHDVVAVNVSNSSMEIACPDEVFNCLKTQATFPYTCNVGFELPHSEELFSMPCTVLRFRRLSQHSYQLVLDFTEELPIAAASLAKTE